MLIDDIVGPYRVLSKLGVGGMGEVWRARDTKLQRDVALKVLPDAVVADPERLARFEREARILAALNHPHIAQILHLETTGSTPALVLELVEGPTLDERIAQGPIPADDALAYARQIADALEAAHDQGIIHRDLKPANIKVRSDGAVKVLDFGLAKAMETAGGVGGAAKPAGLSVSPTLTSPLMTHAGMILGTAAYMSPEQAKGRNADRASDVWAFGCVLFEMLSGTRAFKGEEVSEVLASVLRDEPAWSALPTDIPASVRQMLRLCLQKERQRRLRDMSAIRLALDGAFEGMSLTAAQSLDGRNARSSWRFSALVGLTVLVLGAAGVALLRPGSSAPAASPSIRFSIGAPAGYRLRAGGDSTLLAISPDGMRIAYRAAQVSDLAQGSLHVQALDAFDSVRLPGRSGSGPAFSPDGKMIVFPESGYLKVQPTGGGNAVTICSLDGGGFRGVFWAPDNTIVFATVGTRGLMRVPAAGGTPIRLTTANDATAANHYWPAVLPNGRGVLFTKWNGSLNRAQISVLTLPSGEVVDLVAGTFPVYSSGHLVFAAADRTLRAVPFDQETLRVTGEPTTVLDRVGIEGSGAANFALSSTGTLVYTTERTNIVPVRTLVWMDRGGREEPTGAEPRAYTYARLSPDGTRVALDARDEPPDVWILELARKTLQRLTNDPGLNRAPTWTPDGKRVAFTAARDGLESVHWQAFDGSGVMERLSDGTRIEGPVSFTPDGKGILINTPLEPPYNIGLISLGPPRVSQLLIHTSFSETNAEISPDGHWLAYESDESGRAEVYVRPFPDVDASRRPVSRAGGTRPLWSRKGDELFFFVAPDTFMTVPVRLGLDLTLGAPREVLKWPHAFPANTGRHYDVSADGKRFLLLKDVDDQPALSREIRVVERWGDELKAKLQKR